MNFTITPEQEMLSQTASQFCSDHAVAIEKGHDWQIDREVWRRAAEIGFFSLREAAGPGGRRTGAVDMALVALEAARALFPGPVVASMLAAEILPEAAKGELIVAAVRRPPSGPALVEHLASADAVLVLDSTHVALVEARDLDWSPVEPLDPLTPVGLVDRLPVGAKLGEAELAEELQCLGHALGAAEHAGLARRACVVATAYAQAREQFGRSIGSFQAVKHLLADMAVEAELAQAAALYAVGVLDAGFTAHARRWSMSAAIVGEHAAVGNAESCIQVHGGMGYAWETGAHLILRRAWAIAERSRWADLPAAVGAATLALAIEDEIGAGAAVSVRCDV